MDHMKRVKQTWDELKFHVRPLGYWTFIRTDAVSRKQGMIWLPEKTSDFWGGGLGHQRLVTGVVCAVGPNVTKHHGFTVADRVVFQRLHFAQYKQLDDRTLLGWINANDIAGFPPEETEETASPERKTPPPLDAVEYRMSP
jgi:hypothetical protein